MSVAPDGRLGGLARAPGRRRRGVRALAVLSVLVLVTLQAACSGSDDGGGGEAGGGDDDLGFEPVPEGPSWAPEPRDLGGMSAVAEVDGDRFVLHTRHDDVTFLPGVNLGSTTPGHLPGEMAISEEDIRRWLRMMGQMGFRVLRVYTILPPHFYSELVAYNESHEDAPIYLMQGVYIPDESWLESGNLYDPTVTGAFTAEIRDAAAAVHGELVREEKPGNASGTWTADASPWLAAWIIGSEMDPIATAASDAANADAPLFSGRYFANTPDATPSTRWLAARMDEMATADAERGHAAPIAFVNWPTLDPLTHPEEPLEQEDLVGLDANTIEATDAWPAGTFVSYHAYPYYPDFQRYEPGLQVERDGEEDPYYGYLQALQEYFAGLPLMITEFGVPSSLGSSHRGPLGRGQGDHSEQEAMEIDADLLHIIRDLDLAGALVFAWTDEWFKLTWNTLPRQIPADRRPLWHDPLTNEQYFGLLANDAAGTEDARLRVVAEEPEVTVEVGTDETWVHLVLQFRDAPDEPVTLGFDVVPGGAGSLPGQTAPDDAADYAVVIDPDEEDGRAWVRNELDPIQYDGLPPPVTRDPPEDGWTLQQLAQNRARVIPTTGEEEPTEFFDVGVLRSGEMEPGRDGYDSRNTWQLDGTELTLRIPWGLLGLADPSSKQALVPAGGVQPTTVAVEQLGLTVDLGDERVATADIAWEPWQQPNYEERVKEGIQTLVDAVHDVTPE